MKEPTDGQQEKAAKEIQALMYYGLMDWEAEEVLGALKVLKQNTPRLQPQDVDRIAEEVSRRVLTDLQKAQKTLSDQGWRRQLRQAVKDLVIGVLASGVYELLVYLSTHVYHMDGSERSEVPEYERKLQDVQYKLTRGLPSEERKDLEVNVENLKLGFSLNFQQHWKEQIAASDPIKIAVEEIISGERKIGWDRSAPRHAKDIEASAIQDTLFSTLQECVTELIHETT